MGRDEADDINDDPEAISVKPLLLADAEKIRIAEQWRCSEISEVEARQQLGDTIVDGMIADCDAFREAMRRETSVFLQIE